MDQGIFRLCHREEDQEMPKNLKAKNVVGDRTPSPQCELMRPVRVDETTGEIFEMTGERIMMPGLEPERILKSLEDERMGRTRTLKEIIASRNHHEF
jgi:hypothetical protein